MTSTHDISRKTSLHFMRLSYSLAENFTKLFKLICKKQTCYGWMGGLFLGRKQIPPTFNNIRSM